MKKQDSLFVPLIISLSVIIPIAVALLMLFPDVFHIESTTIDFSSLPFFHAILNGSTAVLLFTGFILIKNKKVVEIKDKQHCSSEYAAFTGFLHIEDYEQFWKSLENNKILIDGEYQISNGLQGLLETSGLFAVDMKWNDMGDLTNYQNAKNNEND